MTYYSYTAKECQQLGMQEGEVAIYTGITNPRKPDTLSPGTNSKNAYVYIWQNGQPRELDACFRRDGAGLDVLEVRTGEEEYTFLRDKPSGYIRQVSGPARPITIANLGAIPLRVDTLLGKFVVHAGSALRLDENAPRREKKKVLLTFGSRLGQSPLKSAELWDGSAWRRLNIREDSDALSGDYGLAVLDGNAIVQYLEVSRGRSILVMDSPERDPDYELYITGEVGGRAALRFQRTDYQDGRVAQRVRKIRFSRWGEKAVYDLQKLRKSLTQDAVGQCTAEFPGAPDILEPPDLTAEISFPDDQTGEFAPKRRRPLISDKLREFLESEDKSGEQPPAPEGQEDDYGGSDAVSRLWELALAHQDGQKALIPEPPESFPE